MKTRRRNGNRNHNSNSNPEQCVLFKSQFQEFHAELKNGRSKCLTLHLPGVSMYDDADVWWIKSKYE